MDEAGSQTRHPLWHLLLVVEGLPVPLIRIGFMLGKPSRIAAHLQIKPTDMIKAVERGLGGQITLELCRVTNGGTRQARVIHCLPE